MSGLFDRLKAAGQALMGLYPAQASPETGAMLRGITPGGRGEPPRRGTAEMLAAYTEMPWLRAVSSRVATNVASARWQLFAAKNSAGKYIRIRDVAKADAYERRKLIRELKGRQRIDAIPSHPFLDALGGGNSFHTGMVLRRLLCIYTDLVGEAFWLKERNVAGAPVRFWPLPSHWIRELPTPDHPYWRVGFRGWQQELPETEILAFLDPNPFNPYGRGSGLAQSLADELDTDEAAAKHSRQFFYNKGRPDLVISGPGLTPEDTIRLEERWLAKARSGGILQAAKPFFLNNAIQVQEIGQTMAEMQMLEIRKFERDTIIQVWGMPPEDLGVIENSNRSTIDASGYKMAVNVVVPRLEFFREVFQERLVPEYDDRLIVDYQSPVKEDKEFSQKVMAAAPHAFSVDEVRDLTERDPLPNGDGQVFIAPIGVEAFPSPADIGKGLLGSDPNPPPA